MNIILHEYLAHQLVPSGKGNKLTLSAYSPVKILYIDLLNSIAQTSVDLTPCPNSVQFR